ncbi:MAG: YdbH domain-containing protein [Candidatus Omnitrophica bacterium]|nr:YdbH domain-containing protein [Candidatus Omnitrophota bacterium]
MRNKRAAFLVFALLAVSFIFFKDSLAWWLLQKNLKKSFPGSVSNVTKLVVWPVFFEIKGFELKSAPFSSLDFLIQDANADIKFSISRSFKGLACRLWVKSANYNDIKIKEIDGVFSIVPSRVSLQGIRARAFGGDIFITGRIDLMAKAANLELKVRLDNIDIRELMQALGMEKRVDSSGLFSGDIRLAWQGGVLKALDGKLSSISSGKFIILDTSLVDKSMAAGDAANIVVENLKNYYYDIGYIDLSNEGKNIKITIQLEGRAGSRHLEIVWHGGSYEER